MSVHWGEAVEVTPRSKWRDCPATEIACHSTNNAQCRFQTLPVRQPESPTMLDPEPRSGHEATGISSCSGGAAAARPLAARTQQGEQRRRHGEAERLGGLEIDH